MSDELLAEWSSTTRPSGTDGLVVLDLSASISSDTYARIGATLDELADTGGRYGLIVFSDTAYLALPPGTPAAELRAFARRFDLPEQTGGALTVPTGPWTDSFSAGTKISTGLQLALDTIKAKRLGRPAVLLVSDLDDDVGDLERLLRRSSDLSAASLPGEEDTGHQDVRLALVLAALTAAVALALRELLVTRVERV